MLGQLHQGTIMLLQHPGTTVNFELGNEHVKAQGKFLVRLLASLAVRCRHRKPCQKRARFSTTLDKSYGRG